MKKCTGCGWTDDKPLGLNKNGDYYAACCPDNNYKELTAMQELLEWHRKSMRSYSETNKMIEAYFEKEKEQLEEARLKGYGEGYDEGVYDAENK